MMTGCKAKAGQRHHQKREEQHIAQPEQGLSVLIDLQQLPILAALREAATFGGCYHARVKPIHCNDAPASLSEPFPPLHLEGTLHPWSGSRRNARI